MPDKPARSYCGKPCRLLGPDRRFLRGYLAMTKEQFASQIGVVALSLAKGLQNNVSSVVSHFPKIKGHKPRLRISMTLKTMTYEYV